VPLAALAVELQLVGKPTIAACTRLLRVATSIIFVSASSHSDRCEIVERRGGRLCRHPPSEALPSSLLCAWSDGTSCVEGTTLLP